MRMLADRSRADHALVGNAAMPGVELRTAVYAKAPRVDTALVFDAPLDDLLEVGSHRFHAVLNLSWRRKASTTTISAEATKLIARYLILTGGTAGTDGGSRFAILSGRFLRRAGSTADWDSAVPLAMATDGFPNVRTPERLTALPEEQLVSQAAQRLTTTLTPRPSKPNERV